MSMLDMKYQKIWCRTFYMEKTGVSELTLYSLVWEQFPGLCLQKVLCGSGSPTPKASMHLAQFRVLQVAEGSLTVCFGFEINKLYLKGDFHQVTARSSPSLLAKLTLNPPTRHFMSGEDRSESNILKRKLQSVVLQGKLLITTSYTP